LVTTLTFVGTASCVPPPGNDTACCLLNGHLLVDAGWCAALSMLRCGCDASALDHVIITHCHHDHYLGLASLLFYRSMQRARLPQDASELRIIGPAEDIAHVVELARAYLQGERFPAVQTNPEVVAVTPGDTFVAGEFEVRTAPVQHQVQGLALRLRDRSTGVEIGISGDTAFRPELAEFFAGVRLLICEAAAGLSDPPSGAQTGHSGVRQAATIARAAGVGQLFLVHTDFARQDQVLSAARAIFPATSWPEPGMTVLL